MQIPLTLDLTLRSIQFAAILGDLVHKTDVYLQRQDYHSNTTCHFSNSAQAHYLVSTNPSLVPSGHWSNHSLGTFFEYYYYSNLSFRLEYLSHLPFLTCDYV